MDGDDASLWKSRWTGFGLAGIILAFFCQEEMAFADPVKLGSLGLFSALTTTLMFELGTSRSVGARRAAIIALIPSFAVTAFIFYHVANEADARLIANAPRCLTLQRDLLSLRSKIPDVADKFQALRCRPVVDEVPSSKKPLPIAAPSVAPSTASPSPAA